MSFWTHIIGAIEVNVPGRTQAEIDYILQTVLDHLPIVTGSENDMEVHINRHEGHDSSCSCDEYEMHTNNLVDRYGNKNNPTKGWLKTQRCYTLTIHADLRDRVFKETVKEFMKWLCRLSKRIEIDSILVRIKAYDEQILIDDVRPYDAMYEYPSWVERGNEVPEPAWWEHLMWKRWEDTPLPLNHVVKYFDVPKADEEFFHTKESE